MQKWETNFSLVKIFDEDLHIVNTSLDVPAIESPASSSMMKTERLQTP